MTKLCKHLNAECSISYPLGSILKIRNMILYTPVYVLFFYFSDFRENIMPESPEIKTPNQHSPLNMTGGMGSTVRDVPRPQSGGTALPGKLL